MGADGVKEVIVQPTHLLYGKEYRHIYETVSSYMGQFIKVSVGDPLLADENDVTTLAGILEQKYPAEEGELLVLMGHGSADMSFPAYDLLERQFRLDGYEQMCIGTVEFEPGIGSILARVRQEKPSRVHLVPLLIAAGGHVINDMAGDGQDSWKNQISREGTDVNCHMTGLGELEAVREMYIQHAKSAREITGDAEK
jgi:sirohydrochlorin cobaltochelatase